MKRRGVLTTTAAIVFAGCLGGDGNDGSRPSTGSRGTAADKSTATVTETPTGSTSEATTTDETNLSQTVQVTETRTESAEIAPETATGTTNTPIPVPDRLTTPQKDGPLTNEAHVGFKNGGSRIVVTGTITGKNGCQTAVLDSVRKTNSGLVITVATEREVSPDAACSMALVELKYRFVVTTDTPPASVTVVHRGMTGKQTITTAKPDS